MKKEFSKKLSNSKLKYAIHMIDKGGEVSPIKIQQQIQKTFTIKISLSRIKTCLSVVDEDFSKESRRIEYGYNYH